MAQPPPEASKNGPSPQELAAQIERLRNALAEAERRFGEELKKLHEHYGESLRVLGQTATEAKATADTAKQRADEAFSAVEAAQTAATEAASSSAAAQTSAESAQASATAAAADAAAAKVQADQAVADVAAVDTDLGVAKGELKKLSDALGDENPDGVPPNAAKLAAFLAVPVRDITFDPIAEKAIAAVLAARQEDVVKLARDIVAGGIATDINKVSQRLGRARMSEARRHILAVAYPDLLRARLKDPIIPDTAKDPQGLAESLIADLDAQGGRLDKFAEAVIVGSEKSMSLNLQGRERAELCQRVRDSL